MGWGKREGAISAADRSASRRLVFGLCFYALVAVVALLWRTGVYGEPIIFASAADAAGAMNVLGDFGLGVGVGLAVAGVSFLTATGTNWGKTLSAELAAALGPLGLKRALLLAVASGFAEEMFFRGALQPRVGLIVASVLFAAAHFLPRRALLPWTAFALIAGFLLGGLFAWTGNLIAPITAHIVVNAINLPLLEHYFGEASGGS